MPNEIFKSEEIKEEATTDNKKEEISEVNSQNTSYIETLKIELDSERAEILDTLQAVLNDKSKTSEEKNRAYEEMKEINDTKAIEDAITKKIKDEYSLESYVKQDDSKIEVVVEGKEHDVKLANKIMRTVQSEFDEPKSISVKFS
jgi:stage III sporulation protein AH